MRTKYEMMAQLLMEYVEDLVTASPKETWSKVDLLVLFNLVKNDSEMMSLLRRFDQRGMRAQESV